MERTDSFQSDEDGPTLQMGTGGRSDASSTGPIAETHVAGSAAEGPAVIGPDDSLLDLLHDAGSFAISTTESSSASSGRVGSVGVGVAAATIEAPSASDGVADDTLPPMPPPVTRPPLMKRAETQEFTLDMVEDDAGDAGPSVEPPAVLATTNTATAADVKLESACVSVGRGEGVTVTLTDPRVSSEQFIVRRSTMMPGTGTSSWSYKLEDRSRNGTLVNKKIVHGATVELQDSDLVEVLPASRVGPMHAIAFVFKRSAPFAGEKGAVVTSASELSASTTEEPAAKKARLDDDAKVGDLFEGAMCSICQEVLHRATSVQPCLHSFCSSCVGHWLRKPGHKICPLCRHAVTGVSRNYTLDGLIDGLLKAHPSKRRSPADLAELDARDPLKDSGYDLGRLLGGGVTPSAIAGHGFAAFGAAGAGDSDSDADHDSEASDDGDDSIGGPLGPPCFHCGSGGGRTLADIASFLAASPMEAARLVRAGVMGNEFERGVLEEWLAARDGRTLSSALDGLLANPNPDGATAVHTVRFERAASSSFAGALPGGPWTELVACRSCGISVLKELIYSLRERIPDAELADRARGRSNCWYGRNCRTQVHTSTHAARLNHICEQTRFH